MSNNIISNRRKTQNTFIFDDVADFFEGLCGFFRDAGEFIADNAFSVVCLFVIVSIAVLIILAAVPFKYTGTVIARRWENEIEVKRYTFCEENDWELPEGATLVKTQSEYHHTYYQTIRVGKTSTTIPHRVYKTKYYYTIYRWLNVDSIITSGTDLHPYYGETNLPTVIENPVEGDLIQADRHNRCYVTVIDDEDKNTYEEMIDYNDWVELTIGGPITYKTTVFNHISNKKKELT